MGNELGNEAATLVFETQKLWRPSGDGSKNLTLVVSNPAKRQQVAKPTSKPPEVPRIVRLLEQARAWRALIDGGDASCAAAIAERSGLSAVYVRNILFLLRLHPDILTAIERLPAGAGDNVNERWLRPITRLPHDRQLVLAAERLKLARERGVG